MLTLFSVPKAFAGRAAVIQDNAIASWTRLGANCEVILFGDDPGVAEAAARHGVRHIPDIRRNAAGTPLIGNVFRRAEEIAAFDTLGLVNSDIILFRDFLPAVDAARRGFRRFLLVGRRTNLDLDEVIDFSADWETALRSRARQRGSLHSHQGSDVFVYSRPMFGEMPDFAMGRTSWDNWLMAHARRTGVALLDATPDMLTLHQNHDYSHVRTSDSVWKGPEASANLTLAGGPPGIYTVYDATHIVTGGRIFSTTAPWYWPRHLRARGERRLFTWLAHHPRIHFALSTLKQRTLAFRHGRSGT